MNQIKNTASSAISIDRVKSPQHPVNVFIVRETYFNCDWNVINNVVSQYFIQLSILNSFALIKYIYIYMMFLNKFGFG